MNNAEGDRLSKIKAIFPGIENYRVKQINHAIYKEFKPKYTEITTLPAKIRDEIATELGDELLSLRVLKDIKGDQSQKVLFETKSGGYKIEAVRMTYHPNKNRKHFHYSLCISSQSGCALGCTFCATGAVGLKQNLSAEEITDQVLYFRQQGMQIDSIVFMGMGEPLANPNIFSALDVLIDSDKFAMSPRRLSLSTVGILPPLKRFIQEYPQVNLAFSLHSPFEEERKKIMPVTESYSIEDCMSMVKEYVEKTNNKVFIAYILLHNFNDSVEHAKALSKLIHKQGKKDYLYHVNLIRYHPGGTIAEFERPAVENVNKFMEVLSKNGIKNTLRQSFGLDIDGACGQLYAEYEAKPKKIGFD